MDSTLEEYIDFLASELNVERSVVETILIDMYEDSPCEGHDDFMSEHSEYELAVEVMNTLNRK